jgi:putative ABC transport system permease protein
MIRLRELLFRLQPFFRRKKIETGLSEEIQSHIEMATEANIAAGMSPKEARYAALREFGGVEQIKERYRDERGIRWLEDFFSDIRFAARSLRKSSGFTTVAVLTLALCIGANSAVFSIIYAVLLKPYPWPDADRLVFVHSNYSKIGRERVFSSVPDYFDRRNGVAIFEESALYTNRGFNFSSGEGVAERIFTSVVTPSIFPLLKSQPALGRAFDENDVSVGATKTIILGDGFWQSRFGGNPNVIGAEVWLDGERHTVIGVMPPGFYFHGPAVQVYVPFVFSDTQKSESGRRAEIGMMVARLKRGASMEQAQRKVNAIHKANADRLLPQHKAAWENGGFGATVVGFLENQVGDARLMLWLVQGTVAACLLIGCANVASLLLARGLARERELAIRAALGAGRSRLIRHLLTEGLLLFILGGLLGVLTASWGVSAMKTLDLWTIPRGIAVSLDRTVFGFTLSCATAMGILFGIIPAWSATRGDNADALKDAGARATIRRQHLSLRSTLVVIEVALALMLVATAALLTKSFSRVQRIDPGFVRENVITALLALPWTKYPTAEKREAFYSELLDRVRRLPGVTSAACATFFPFGASHLSPGSSSYGIEGYTPPAGELQLQAIMDYVSPDYFTTMGIPLLRGRVFASQDTRTTGDVVVIDKILADRYWPGEDPIGKRLIFGTRAVPNTTTREHRKWEIIGVVAPVKFSNVESATAKETIYFSSVQTLGPTSNLAVKTEGSAARISTTLRAMVSEIDATLPIYDVNSLEKRLQAGLQRRRMPMILVGLFAGIALLLAAIGVYGVLAFAVGQRTKEIGVRMALGATATSILKMILLQGTGLVGLGLAIGLGGYFALSTVIRKLLFSVETTDYVALVIAPATLALVALAACLIPARRATKVDPIVALRAE